MSQTLTDYWNMKNEFPALSEVNLQLNQISFQYSILGSGGMGELHLSIAADFQQLHDVIMLIWTINMHQDHRESFQHLVKAMSSVGKINFKMYSTTDYRINAPKCNL